MVIINEKFLEIPPWRGFNQETARRGALHAKTTNGGNNPRNGEVSHRFLRNMSRWPDCAFPRSSVAWGRYYLPRRRDDSDGWGLGARLAPTKNSFAVGLTLDRYFITRFPHFRLHFLLYDRGKYWKMVEVGVCDLWVASEPSHSRNWRARILISK